MSAITVLTQLLLLLLTFSSQYYELQGVQVELHLKLKMRSLSIIQNRLKIFLAKDVLAVRESTP